jgi:hypothetical protein
MPKHLNTGTAADLLGFEDYIDATGQTHLTRVATTDQEWIVSDWDGEQYCIRFDKNFSKKHLFTFSKKTEETKKEAALISGRPGKHGQDAQNWSDAEHAQLYKKVNSALDHRAVSGTCRCGHAYNRHVGPCPGCNHPKGVHTIGLEKACAQAGCGCTAYIAGKCNQCPAAAPCPRFQTPYGAGRDAKHKPTSDPLSGAQTTRNTCIVLNYVPKSEFESVVVKSVQALEKPHGWTRGSPLANAVGADVLLKWDFGDSRRGAILQAQQGTDPATWPKMKGCYVKAKKTHSTVGKQTWQIYHMETHAPHTPF